MKDVFSILTERRILEAIARGDSKSLPGAGKPLKIDGLYFLPRKLRAAYIVLKNSGYLDQTSKENDRFVPPGTEKLDSSAGDSSISKQELSEKILNHNVMMDCRRRK
ncbi:DUF1992 domain-containing protein [Desulfosporosinus sp. BICA1-9]|uniref:DnaJ family domain-containing protein n=1 Tax=Desulfosporosinus sp. BICA1-9 TaxID=1531958 RepID=UPI00054BCAD2|nr:DUF1992 domain-containing protein [Desulfosporosinus sp. BICA1-9]KJS48893.1 MAG: hypothetical protein VR66_11515 [Peptococcaceae bacterium BRH_c23]KJS87477.1 MAG: hypothetical protein JL57_13980 [Desulfosporosinus sp. BICA1-9]HBW36645.1 DUF1992 domain-containing protein [Desulfosporosinus sp.]